MTAARPPRGRYAPSPTGELHVGNASSALLAWLSVRARHGSFVMRIEDLDRLRVRPGLEERIFEELAWLGLDWDEGPDVGGGHAPYRQSARASRYAAALDRLRTLDRVYPCFCSRRDIAAAASAPQEPGDEVRYPGTCRRLGRDEAEDRRARGRRHAWRFRADGPPPPFEDRVYRGVPFRSEPGGDFVVHRADGVAAYQLAVVVDDAEMEIGEVVRGDDLLSSTPRQVRLYRALGLRAPVFGHVPLLLGPDGVRLSKRHDGVTVRELREAGLRAEQVVGRLAHLLGLRPDPGPQAAADLVPGFSLDRIEPRPTGIRIDPARW